MPPLPYLRPAAPRRNRPTAAIGTQAAASEADFSFYPPRGRRTAPGNFVFHPLAHRALLISFGRNARPGRGKPCRSERSCSLFLSSFLLGGFSRRFRGYGYGYGHRGIGLI